MRSSAIFGAACLIAGAANALELRHAATQEVFLPVDIGQALARGAVLARLEAGDAFDLLGGTIAAREAATVYLAASSEFVSAAVLRGTVSVDGRQGEAGHVFVRPVAGARTERFSFDVRAFEAATPAALNEAEHGELEALRARQDRRIFWGGLERTGFDAQSPTGDAMLEAVRRDYLLRPAVMEVRRSAQGDAQQLARETAARFVSGLAARDEATVEALLSPLLFAEGGRGQAQWLEARRRFAGDLVRGGLPAVLARATVGDGDLASGFEVEGVDRPWRLELQSLDTMVFVKALEPSDATASAAGEPR